MIDPHRTDPAYVIKSSACVVLAGGAGERIGGTKPARVLAGMTLLDRALCSARSYSDLVAVSVRDCAQFGSVPVIIDPPDISGPLAGVAATMDFARKAGRRWALTIPCDMPLLPTDLLARLAVAIGEGNAAMAANHAGLQPVCCLWQVEALERLPAFLEGEDRSLRGFADFVGYSTVMWGEKSNPFFNVNSPIDFAAASQLLGNRSRS